MSKFFIRLSLWTRIFLPNHNLYKTHWNVRSLVNHFSFPFLCSFKLDEKTGATGEALQEFEIIKWPPVLHVQLKRFGYDTKTNSLTKNNKRFDFCSRLDLSQYSDDAIYTLHSVLGKFYSTIKTSCILFA